MVELVTVKFVFKNEKGQSRERLIPMREDSTFEAMFKEYGKKLAEEDKNLSGYYLSEVIFKNRTYAFNSVRREYKWLHWREGLECSFLEWVPVIVDGDVVICTEGMIPLEDIEKGDLRDFDDCPLADGRFVARIFDKEFAKKNPV